MIIKDWTLEAARELQADSDAPAQQIAGIIRKHCPFTPDPAYEEVSRMDPFPGFDPVRARRWCLDLAGCSAAERINRDEGPYLVRYYLAGWQPRGRGPASAVFLHHFVSSDPPGSVHSHPWAWSSSLILVGGYREYRCTGAGGAEAVRVYRPGDVNVLATTDRHRIELLEADCWTLFLAGPFAQEWKFDRKC